MTRGEAVCAFDLACKLRAKPVPPIPYGCIAYVHSSFVQQLFHIPHREWKPHLQHNGKLDNLRASFKIV